MGLRSMGDHLKGFKQGSVRIRFAFSKDHWLQMTHGLWNGKNKQETSPLVVAAVLMGDYGSLDEGISRGNVKK